MGYYLTNRKTKHKRARTNAEAVQFHMNYGVYTCNRGAEAKYDSVKAETGHSTNKLVWKLVLQTEPRYCLHQCSGSDLHKFQVSYRL